MFGAYVKENRKALIALAVYTVVFALVFWLYRLPLGAAGYAALVCLFLLALWFAVDYRRFAARLRLLQRLEQEITLSTEQLPEPDGMLKSILNVLVNVAAGQTRFSVVCLPTRWLRVMIRQNLCLGWRRLINFTFRSM